MNIQGKKCTKCDQIKLSSEFFEKKSENRLSSWCRKCLYTYQHQRWIARKQKAVELLGGCCNQCGYKKNLAAMHFHHKHDKDMEWSSVNRWPWKRIVEELKKCILLCANCHAEIHNPDYMISPSENANIALNREIISSGKCPICLEQVYGTKYCSIKCSQFARRKVRPTKEILALELSEKSFVSLGKKYNVSDNTIRKWAKSYMLL